MPALRAKDFTPSIPIDLVFRTIEPKAAPDNGYGPALVFDTSRGSLYLPQEPARDIVEQLREQRVKAGEAVRVARIATTHGGHRWHVERPNIERQLQDSIYRVQNGMTPAPAPVSLTVGAATPLNCDVKAAPPPPQDPEPKKPSPASTKMMACFLAAIDAIAEAQAYAKRKELGITFTSENVTSAALSCYINDCRNGGR